MARFGTWNPLAGNWASQSRMTQVDILSIHTMVGSLAGTDSMWRRTGYSGNHSHFGIGGNGECTQWQDTTYRAAANYNGNWHIISVECADVGAPFPVWNTNDGAAVPAFSAPQIETLAQLIAAMCKAHNIPCVLIPDSKVGRRGIGYHRLGVPGYMLPGTEQWSTAQGKVCPGNRRIAQIPQVIARAQQILNGDSDLDGNQATQLDYIYKAVRGGNADAKWDVLSLLWHGLFDALNSDNHAGNADDNTVGHAVSGHKYGKQASDKADQIIAALAKLGSAPVSGGSVVAGDLSDADVDRIADALAAKLAGRLQS
jgi:hypothetical protein